MEIEFSFAKQSGVICGPQHIHRGAEGSKPAPLTSSPIEFAVVPPATMKVPANGSVILNIQAKLKNSYQLAVLKEAKATSALSAAEQQRLAERRAEKYSHLLLGKVKDTQVLFSFIIEATVIEASGPLNAMS